MELKDFFGRINSDGNIQVFELDGIATRMPIDNLYPIDSSFSVLYEHPEGIVISLDDAEKIGLEYEPTKGESK